MIEILKLIADEGKILLTIMAVLTVHLLLPLIILVFMILHRLLWETFFPFTEVPEKEKRLRLTLSVEYDSAQSNRNSLSANVRNEAVNTSENTNPESDARSLASQQEDPQPINCQSKSRDKAIAVSGETKGNLDSRKSKAA